MRVLIVDDELPIREWLKMAVGQADEKVEAEAYGNGLDAWKAFGESGAQIVITDIKMPRMNGLELLQKIKEARPKTYVVMLTSYGEFEYAREAIKYQANEYILKNEITNDVLHQIFRNYQNSIVEKEREEKPYLCEQIREGKEIEGLSDEEGERVFALAFWEKGEEQPSFDSYQNGFVEQIEPFSYEKGVSVWLCRFKKQYSTSGQFSQAMAFCEGISALKDSQVGFGDFTNRRLTACIRARKALSLGFYEEAARVLPYQMEKEEGLDEIKRQKKKAIAMISRERQEEAEGCLEELLELLEKYRLSDVERVKNCFQDLVDAYKVAKMEFSGQELEELCVETKEKIRKASTYRSAKELLLEFLGDLKGTLMLEDGPYTGYVRQAMAYVAENYASIEQISQVADYVNLNMEYFCRLFKGEVGKTFNTYLTEYRIKKAVELLSKTDLKVYEVAERVGYPNLSYFSRVFKKITGQNPFFYKK